MRGLRGKETNSLSRRKDLASIQVQRWKNNQGGAKAMLSTSLSRPPLSRLLTKQRTKGVVRHGILAKGVSPAASMLSVPPLFVARMAPPDSILLARMGVGSSTAMFGVGAEMVYLHCIPLVVAIGNLRGRKIPEWYSDYVNSYTRSSFFLKECLYLVFFLLLGILTHTLDSIAILLVHIAIHLVYALSTSFAPEWCCALNKDRVSSRTFGSFFLNLLNATDALFHCIYLGLLVKMGMYFLKASSPSPPPL